MAIQTEVETDLMCRTCRGKGQYAGLDITCRSCHGSGIEPKRPSTMTAHDLATIRAAILTVIDDGDPRTPRDAHGPLWCPDWNIYSVNDDKANDARLRFCDAVQAEIVKQSVLPDEESKLAELQEIMRETARLQPIQMETNR